ncbi:MAG: putative hydroxymethylpyrimidine transporter CytX [Eubacteriales bacterium]|nr:putative hydroxymethylpyrimidine transporter CytX [Eubacteriales bacterium]
MKSKTSVFSNVMIWFGAGMSIAEILTGTLLAPLGFVKGILAVITGHLIGCVLLFLAGMIGARTEKSAMETVKMSFGQKGSLLFSWLNVIQLIGWTAVMIVSGAEAANIAIGLGSYALWAVVIGALIVLWVMVGVKGLNIINTIAMSALFLLTLVLSSIIFRGRGTAMLDGEMTFGAAVELSVAMPLSWLPLISDYTREAKKPFVATLASCITYFVVSVWMYIIGLGAALFVGELDIAAIMVKAGLGVAALVIVLFSTVTTTFLDVWSAGVSAESISKRIKEKPFAVGVAVVGTLLAVFTPITKLEDFLYLIGSVFAPMIAVQIADFFILKRNSFDKNVDGINLAIWLVGFVVYRLFMNLDTPVGYTLPAMLVVGIISLTVNKLTNGGKDND